MVVFYPLTGDRQERPATITFPIIEVTIYWKGLQMSITLSGGIPTWFIDRFKNTLYHVQQQKDSKFGKAVTVESVSNAEDKAFDMLDKFELTAKTSRNPQTPIIDAVTQRRWVFTDPFHNAVLWDEDDDLSVLLDPKSNYVRNFVQAVNRKKDDIILASFDGAVSSGRRAAGTITWASQLGNTKYTGVDSSGDVTGRTIAHDTSAGNAAAGDTNLTTEKIELVKEYFANNDVDEDMPIWGAISPRQATNLFGQEEYVNIDFNDAKPLTNGKIIRDWMGINWIVSTKILLGTANDVDLTTNVFRCPFWVSSGIILGVQDAISVRIDTRTDLSMSQQIYVHMNMGAFRQDEDLVCFVECQDT